MTQTIGQWLSQWQNTDAAKSIPESQRAQYSLIINSVLVDSAFAELPLSEATSSQLFSFYRKRLRKSLPTVWARRIYSLAHFLLAEAASKNLAAKTFTLDAQWLAVQLGQTVRRALAVALAALIVICAVFVGNASIQAANDGDDLLSTMLTQAREAGFGPLIATAEDFYYTYIDLPIIGGTPSINANFNGSSSSGSHPTSTPKVASIAVNAAWGAAELPSSLPLLLSTPALVPQPAEGAWEPTAIKVNGTTAVYVARIRPDAVHTSYYANLVWFDPKLLAFQQIPGTHVPEGNYDHGTGQVSPELHNYYVAGLADAFLLADSQGGYMLGDKVIRKMRDGKATLVTYTDGTIDVIQWGRDPLRGTIQAARQNLQLNVDGGVSQVQDETQSKWGWAWHGVGSGKNLVWRTAIGIRADGTVVYCVGNWLSAKSLADMMVRAGAVRSMILDMNSGYANGYFYGPYPGGKKIDPTIPREVTRFSKPSTRDFIAVFMKSPAN